MCDANESITRPFHVYVYVYEIRYQTREILFFLFYILHGMNFKYLYLNLLFKFDIFALQKSFFLELLLICQDWFAHKVPIINKLTVKK